MVFSLTKDLGVSMPASSTLCVCVCVCVCVEYHNPLMQLANGVDLVSGGLHQPRRRAGTAAARRLCVVYLREAGPI